MLLNMRQPTNSSRRKVRGVLPVFQTPYHADETIDVATLEKEVAWLYDCGAAGVVMATTLTSWWIATRVLRRRWD